ncbi:polysaccharide deacetylase family protein [Tyzzerella sp. An114]|uniref:polysaccharide deacetylase family protein n=1 Tax=Tyzzerella sp. An114 TaxID=1965545 RepID=UPI0013DDF0C6|nr:polysaccharide deacetylase family protein [Tyzzerella sp. An114]
MNNGKIIEIIKKKAEYIGVCVCLLLIAVFAGKRTTVQVFNQLFAENERKLPIYCVDTPEKKVAISFDAAWGADDTDELLRILDENDVKTTFFMCGYWVEDYPEEVKKIAEAGHDLGNHSSTHPHMSQMSKEQIKNELMTAHEKVKELTGQDMFLFRPPFGEYDNKVIEAAEECGYYTIQWDVDSLDWKEYGVEHEISQVLNHKHLGNGSIILFHNDAKYTPEALDSIIKGLKENGYEIVPLSDLIIKNDYHIDHEGRQIKN